MSSKEQELSNKLMCEDRFFIVIHGLIVQLKKWNTLQWRHIGRDSVSYDQPHDCLLNRLFRRRKQTQKRKHQSSASLAFVRGIHRGPVNSPHKWPVKRKMFPFDDVFMKVRIVVVNWGMHLPAQWWPFLQVQRIVLTVSMLPRAIYAAIC